MNNNFIKIGNVLGVSITYFPTDENLANLVDISKQVDKLVIVDNGSGEETEKKLDLLAIKNSKIEIIKNGENIGLDKATNIGILKGNYQNYNWVLTLDQDSKLEAKMIAKMLEVYTTEIKPKNSKIKVLVPIIYNYNQPQKLKIVGTSYQLTEFGIASGMLIKSSLLKKIGLMDESFFIDGIDQEFCLRVRKKGYQIAIILEAKLYHRMGYRLNKTFLGKTRITSNYNHLRRYYIARNSLQIFFRYIWFFPSFCLNLIWQEFIKNNIKILLFEGNKVQKFLYTWYGIWDFIRGKKGKF